MAHTDSPVLPDRSPEKAPAAAHLRTGSAFSLWRVRIAVLAGFLLLLAIPTIAAWLDEPFYLRLFTRIMIMGLVALSLDLILGFGGMVSFGHAAFLGIGMYVVAILSWHADNGELLLGFIPGTTNAFIVWPLGALLAGLAALFIGAVSLRTSGLYYIMITLAFAQMFYYVAIVSKKYGGDDGLQLSDQSWPVSLGTRVEFYYLVLVSLVVLVMLMDRVVRSRFGMVLRGIRQNERRMRAIGYPTRQYKLVAFVISGAVAGYAGVLMANFQTFVSPSLMDWGTSGTIMIMVVLGGIGTLYGPILGAAAYLLLDLVLGSYTTHWQAIFGPVMVLIVLFARKGLWGAIAGDARHV
jgi:branched-chain amino acid transport system permease protein